MRLINGMDGTWLPTHFPMALARAAHMAPGTCINEPLNSPTRTVVILLGPLTLLTIMAVLLVMEGIRDSSDYAAGSESSPIPL